MDYISKLPVGIVENILCLVPIQEAVRTSILSKEWRYRWTKIPKLVFDERTFKASTGGPELKFCRRRHGKGMSSERCKLSFAIFQVLLSHDGTIHDFSLSMKSCKSCTEIYKIVRYLSLKNTVKKLTFDVSGHCYNFLPSYIFSMTQLTYLYLSNCSIDYTSIPNGLGRLTSLYVVNSFINNETLLELLSKSPSLKTVTLKLYGSGYSFDSTISDFFKCLPVIEHLSVRCELMMCYHRDPDGVPKELSTALVHLKYFCMEHMCFIDDDEIPLQIPLLLLVIRSSPNLEKLKLEIIYYRSEEEKRGLFLLKDYSDIWLEHLNEFEITDLTNKKEAELDFVKLILAKSPVLKKVTIFLYNGTDEYEESEILRSLLLSPHASPVVHITVQRYDEVEDFYGY